MGNILIILNISRFKKFESKSFQWWGCHIDEFTARGRDAPALRVLIRISDGLGSAMFGRNMLKNRSCVWQRLTCSIKLLYYRLAPGPECRISAFHPNNWSGTWALLLLFFFYARHNLSLKSAVCFFCNFLFFNYCCIVLPLLFTPNPSILSRCWDDHKRLQIIGPFVRSHRWQIKNVEV